MTQASGPGQLEVAVLDLGSNSFHLEHFSFDGAGGWKQTLDAKQTLQLGHQVFADGYLDQLSQDKAHVCVAELLQLSQRGRRSQNFQLVTVATSALRTASNGDAFLRELNARHGINVTLLSTHQEALLTYEAASSALGAGNRPVAVVDLGGGSVELALGQGNACDHAISLPLGALRMARAVGCDGRLDRQGWERLSRIAGDQLQELPSSLRSAPPEVLCFASGTARAVRKLATHDSDHPGAVGSLSAKSLRTTLSRFVDRSPAALETAGIPTDRARTVLVAAAIMLRIAEYFGAPPMVTINRGLRDGIARQAYERWRVAQLSMRAGTRLTIEAPSSSPSPAGS